ncbi:MAG: hypothetical protein IPF56_12860 [Chloroflexi bacterium]|nr:hypothetical protein [Chloroflexota bacterium]
MSFKENLQENEDSEVRMGSVKQFLAGSKHRLSVLLVFVLAMASLMGMVLMSLSARGAAYAQAPDVTPTPTFDEELQAYINAHIIQGDIRPTPAAPEPVVAPQTPLGVTEVVSYSVALLSDSERMGAPGEVVTYTLTLSNTGVLSDVYDITASSVWGIALPTTTYSLTNGTSAPVMVAVTVPMGTMEGDADTAVITATSRTDSLVNAAVLLTTTVEYNRYFFPMVYKSVPPPPTPALTATNPNSANDWQMNWTIADGTNVLGYELQQSQDAAFVTGITTYNLSTAAVSQLINTVEPSHQNVYYFRLRALGKDQNSGWTSPVQVIGAYLDNFTSNQTGWSGPTLKEALRRLTFIEKSDTWYENNDWLIARVEDSWDWLIASPMQPAPKVPYVIEYRSKPANLGNLVSHGIIFGADWNGGLCPDWSSLDGVYAHTNCFNHFYNNNMIWSSDKDLTLLWERIDFLVWCPSCGGSPLKRLGDTRAVGFSLNASDWNDYRIEVRQNEIRFFINGSVRFTYTDTRWVNDPYFGVFVSTDEYSNSTWRYEYFKITPLDS